MRRTTLTLAVLLFPFFCMPSAAELQGSYFAVIVEDMETSLRWYTNVFDVRQSEPVGDGERFQIVNLTKPGLFIEILEVKAAQQRPDGMLTGPFKAGILVKNLNDFVGRLPEGIPRPEVLSDERNNLLLIQLKDPDGNVVQVMEILGEQD